MVPFFPPIRRVRPDGFARAAIACNEHGEAEKALRELIDASGEPAAVRLYGDLVLADSTVICEYLEELSPQPATSYQLVPVDGQEMTVESNPRLLLHAGHGTLDLA